MAAQLPGVDRFEHTLRVPRLVLDLLAARDHEDGRREGDGRLVLEAVAFDRSGQVRMRARHAAIDDGHDLRRRGGVVALDEIPHQPVRRGEDPRREVDRVAERDVDFLPDDVHQVTENSLASRPAVTAVASTSAPYSGPAYTVLITASTSTSDSTPAFTARRIRVGRGSL